MTADELLRDGFSLSLPTTPLLPMHVVTVFDEALYDADIVINALPSTETRKVFEQAGKLWAASRRPEEFPIVVSLSKGVETDCSGRKPHIVTPTQMIHEASGVPLERILYLGGPNIAREVWSGTYATARLCGFGQGLREILAAFLRNPDFVVWDAGDVITVREFFTVSKHGKTLTLN